MPFSAQMNDNIYNIHKGKELRPLVTVYVPCRNYGKYLAQCVESVLAQLYTEWELIIVDEASTDDTAVIAEAMRRRQPDRITILHNSVAIGLQKLANRVLGIAKGKYLMRLDADDWLDESALLLMVTKLEVTPRAGLVYGNHFYTDPDGRVLGMERRHRLGEEDMAGHLPPHGACTLFSTRALKAVGGYSEDVDAQDGWELWFKLINRVGAVNLEVPVFYYRQHGTSLSRDYKRLLTARSRIFERISNSLEGSYKPTCAAVIPVRESYPGFEGVPYRELDGRSLLERAILAASGSSRVTQVIVSSKSRNVLDYAERLEMEDRVPKHARLLRVKVDDIPGSVPIRDIMLHAGEYYREVAGTFPDVVTFLSIHAFRRGSKHIDKALNVLRITESDSVVSVQEEREPLFCHGPDGLRVLNPGRFQDISYDRERLFRFNGAIIATWWEVLQSGALLGDKVGYIEMSLEDSGQIKTASMLGGPVAG